MLSTGKIGRPTKSPKRGERRVSLGLRVTADVKRRLDAVAAKHGRSQSQEAEFRLQRSFDADAEQGGEELRHVAQLMLGAFGFEGQRLAPGKTPGEYDPETYRGCIMAVIEALANAHPTALADPEVAHMFFESAKGRIVTRQLAKKGDKS